MTSGEGTRAWDASTSPGSRHQNIRRGRSTGRARAGALGRLDCRDGRCSREPLRRQNRTDMNVPKSLNPTRRYAALAGALKSLTYKVTMGARVLRANAT